MIINKEKNNNSYHERSIAMAAFEAGLMISNSISRHRINEMDSLVTGLAFLCRPTERHFFFFSWLPNNTNLQPDIYFHCDAMGALSIKVLDFPPPVTFCCNCETWKWNGWRRLGNASMEDTWSNFRSVWSILRGNAIEIFWPGLCFISWTCHSIRNNCSIIYKNIYNFLFCF